jgi:hypothetical protein
MKTAAAAQQFLDQHRIAVTGVSRKPKGHGSNVVYRRLRERGYDVIAINPNATAVEGDTCFPDLRSVPGAVQAVVIGTSPARAAATVQECIELGVPLVWMHQGLGPGSVSQEAAALARDHGLVVIDGGCPCMFGATSDPFHRFVKTVQTVRGKLPRDVQDRAPVDSA